MTEDKFKIIDEIYHNPVWGYGSIRSTYLQAYKQNPSIRLIDVKDYFNNMEDKQTRFSYKNGIHMCQVNF